MEYVKKRFVKFRAGGFSLDNAPWSGRPVEVDSDQIEKLIENNQHYTPQEMMANILKISKSQPLKIHLHQFGYVNRSDVWVPRKQSREAVGKTLTIFPHGTLPKRHKKCSVFKTNCDGW